MVIAGTDAGQDPSIRVQSVPGNRSCLLFLHNNIMFWSGNLCQIHFAVPRYAGRKVHLLGQGASSSRANRPDECCAHRQPERRHGIRTNGTDSQLSAGHCCGSTGVAATGTNVRDLSEGQLQNEYNKSG